MDQNPNYKEEQKFGLGKIYNSKRNKSHQNSMGNKNFIRGTNHGYKRRNKNIVYG
jgi:hypothetical protein